MTSQEAPPPHVLLVSAPLKGHANPLFVLGRRLASEGLLVTFTTAAHAGLKFAHPHQHDNKDGAAAGGVGCGALRFEQLRDEGVWGPDDPRYRVTDDVARHLDNVAPTALAGLIHRQAGAGRPVTCVVANAFAPWALRAAAAAGVVPSAMLWTQSCTVLSLYYHYLHTPSWLDAQAPRSVVFAAFGSLVKLSRDWRMLRTGWRPRGGRFYGSCATTAATTTSSSRRTPLPRSRAAAAGAGCFRGASSGACSRTAPWGASSNRDALRVELDQGGARGRRARRRVLAYPAWSDQRAPRSSWTRAASGPGSRRLPRATRCASASRRS
ncbi:unnamed protein product [Urochloa humidicola]